ncbi:MAG: hypothetical protein MJ141_05425 [Clostridia bacterium]|nr:hypothetical protein [Clostridia bacterium]
MSIIINDDFQRMVTLAFERGWKPGAFGEKEIRADIDRFQGTEVSDFFLNLNAQLSYSPSSLWETAGEKYLKTEENGEKVDFKNTYLAVWHDVFTVQGLDLYKIAIDELRKCGIRPWLSFRLNDTHDNMTMSGGIRRSDYTYAARGEGLSRMRHHEKSGYYDDCLDFEIASVREHHLSYIKEQLARYDADGIELDWLREPYCFRPGHEEEGAVIITAFMEEVNALALEAGKKYGHPVKIAARVLSDPENNRLMGFDIPTWMEKGLIDLLIVSPRWQSNDDDMPMELWKTLVKPYGVRLAACLTDRVMARPDGGFTPLTPELTAGLAMNYLSRCADDVYLSNYTYLVKDEIAVEDAYVIHFEKDPMVVMNYVGDAEKLEKAERRHIAAFRDITAPGGPVRQPLPMPLRPDTRNAGWSMLRIPTGKATGEATLRLAFSEDAGEVEVFLNAEKCGEIPVVPCDTDENLAPTGLHAYRPGKLTGNAQLLEVKAEKGELLYAEIAVKP